MKKTYFIIFIIFSVLSCSKDKKMNEVLDPNSYFGECTYNLNGINFSTRYVWARINNNNETGFGIKMDDFESLSFFYFNLSKLNEKQYIKPRPIDNSKPFYLSYYINDRSNTPPDAGCNDYHIIEADSLQNWLIITKYDTVTNEIWGKFNASTKLETFPSRCNPGSPQYARFTNGEFHTKLFK